MNNKKKIMIGSFAGAALLLLIIAGIVYSKGRDREIESVISNTENVDVDSVINDVANAAQGNIISDTTEKEIETSKSAEVTPEPTVTQTSVTESTNKETVSKEQTTPTPANTETITNTDAEWATLEPSETAASTKTNLGTPQEYHGDPEGRGPGRIIVKGFDYSNVSGLGEWKGAYWTASNGVEIKVIEVAGRATGVIPVLDGKGKDNEPNSPFDVAVAEALEKDINNYKADLNVTIPLAPYKRTEIDINDKDLVAYRDAYDYKLWKNDGMAKYYEPYKYGDPINMRYAVASDGIGEFDGLGAIFWRITRENDYWKVRINANLAEFRWDGIHQALRYLSPDGDALYQVIYEDCYFGSPTILEYDEWFAVGNSQIYQTDPARGQSFYYFK